MNAVTRPDAPCRVVVVGGGIGAVETVLALNALAGERVHVTLVAPEPEFSLRPLSVDVPFGRGPVDTVPLAGLMEELGGAFHQDAVLSVDGTRRVVDCAAGAELPHDALVLTPGAPSVPALSLAQGFVSLTFDPHRPAMLTGITQAIQEGWSHTLAFIVPPGVTWPLPLYELALSCADEVRAIEDVTLHFITPEPEPLAVFGSTASDAVARLLADAGVTFHGGVDVRIADRGELDIGAGMPLAADRVVALTRMEGPALNGVPADADGFILVDDWGRVPGADAVWAAGDGTDQPIKQGGLACQQADSIAAQIAAAAGADVDPQPPTRVLRGRLLGGRADCFLERTVDGDDSRSSTAPLWWPPAKVASRYLSDYLIKHGIVDPEPKQER
jgi:sulfide:quinone oxidoreductase